MICAHMVVKNEDRFVWYAISSVLPYVDEFIIYDTGSTDDTVKIIKSFAESRIKFKQFQIKGAGEIAGLRNKQIQETQSSWFWIVDGDEIYSENLCKEIITIIKEEKDKLEGIVVGRYDLLGDIYHYQDKPVGAYEMLGKKGHMALRLINKKNTDGLHVAGNYPYEEYFDKNGVDLIFHPPKNFGFTKGKLFHAMYLPRSSKGADLNDTFHRNKYKVESGKKFAVDFHYPEVFSRAHPAFIADVIVPRTKTYELAATIITPIKNLKRKLL